jgi:hypothetical protein
MPEKRLLDALDRLKRYFKKTLPAGALPQIVFHGAEPLLNRDAVFAGIDAFMVEVFAFQELHDQEGLVGRGRAEVEDLYDVRVAESAGDHCTVKASQGFGV